MTPLEIDDANGLLRARFEAMTCDCEVLAEGADPLAFETLATSIADEAHRIERKFGPYSEEGILAAIRRHAGEPQRVDAETATLIDVAAFWHERSDGRIDITGGALKYLWRFGVAAAPPEKFAVMRALENVGFHRLRWQRPFLLVPRGMELDFGGIAKEYAVDCAHDLLAERLGAPALVNYGGDIRVTRSRARGAWRIGLESADGERDGKRVVLLGAGALATSGDARRHVVERGTRYGHVLDPRTGWPVVGAPPAISVAAATCIEAGLYAKTALLHGSGAEAYLSNLGVRHWIVAAS
jgi:thiamine biosynthesis lipoprotein